MTMKVFNVGDVLAAADLNEYGVNTRYADKPGDTTRATNTTLTNDPDLSLTADANKKYLVEVFIDYQASSTPNLKTAFTVPAAATFTGCIIAVGAGGSSVGITAINASNPITAAQHIAGFGAFDGAARYSGILATAGSGGAFTLQWAQDTSSALTTIVRAGSSMLLRRVA